MPRVSVFFTRIQDFSFDGSINFKTSRTEFTYTSIEKPIVFGEYTYKQPQRDGTVRKYAGEFVIHLGEEILGITTEYDRPEPAILFEEFCKGANAENKYPKYQQEASRDFYETYGIKNYNLELQPELASSHYDSILNTVEPVEEAKRIAQAKDKKMGKPLIKEVTHEYFDEGYYISGMKVKISPELPLLSFSAPLIFTGIEKDLWGKDVFRLLVGRCCEILNSRVKSVEQVRKQR